MEPFLALITPLASQQPPTQPPGIWPPGSGIDLPTHPIVPGGPPPGIWPSPGYPAHPISPGGPPPGIWPSPGHPTHPIAPGGAPPGIWHSPGYPAHPIVIPPEELPPWWPGSPAHPIPPTVWPTPPGGETPPEGERQKLIEWKTAWSPTTGWILVGVPNIPAPTPST
jgi:hypothetical protein